MKNNKYFSGMTCFLLILLAVVVTSFTGLMDGPQGDTVFAAPSGDHGRKKDDDKAVKQGDLFGDLWLVVRDVSAGPVVEPGDDNLGCDGDPILFEWVWPDSAYNTEGDFEPTVGIYPVGYRVGEDIQGTGFDQPISFTEVLVGDTAFDAGEDNPDDDIVGPNEEGQFIYTEYVNSYGDTVTVYLIPLDPAEGKIPDAYAQEEVFDWADQVMEVDMGRLNIARSTQQVIDARYWEAIGAINEATAIALDPAGRLLLTLPAVDEEGGAIEVLKTIDAPLENLALYQAVMRDGCLTGLNESAQALIPTHLACGAELTPPDAADILRAASFMAGAGDKAGHIGTDLVVNLNSELGLNILNYNPSEKVFNVTRYFDYVDCGHIRSTIYDEPEEANQLMLLQPTVDGDAPQSWEISPVNIYTNVFEGEWSLPANGNPEDEMPLIKFVRAADDALGVIYYIHNFAVPEYPIELRP